MPLTLTFDYGLGLGMMFGELDLAEPGYCHRVRYSEKIFVMITGNTEHRCDDCGKQRTQTRQTQRQ